ncbi:FAD-dependent oxidoreductase [Altererythrobacter aquiaggeris]|uniref:NAD(P)/FAD-dependent oxidoreductase n=1 Tax=Aestuarierythrobacter aquiaggeris TaxID=1898396 RepID=UPI00301A9975
MSKYFDIAIVGAGIAGSSLAAELARQGSLVVLEGESAPGYHSTGRSAAFWEECYGGPEIVPLTLASGEYLRDGGFLTERGALYAGRDEDAGKLDEFMARFENSGAQLERIDRARLAAILPGVKPAWTDAIWEPACADIDVAALHAHFLSRATRGGAVIQTNARLVSAAQRTGGWDLTCVDGSRFAAGILVNAAGAWADQVAAMAGVKPVGITPYLRTVAQLRTDPAPDPAQPLVLDISGRFYFKPESGRVWLSPHDEEPSPPCDVAAGELGVATAIAQFEKVVDWRIEAVERKWAGLRSFAPDRMPVFGFDPDVSGFFWFAGQGGFGIQTSPAAAAGAYELLTGDQLTGRTSGVDMARYSPARFMS